MKVTLSVSTDKGRAYVGEFPPPKNFFASSSLVATFLAPEIAPMDEPVDLMAMCVACQGPASGAGAVIVTGRRLEPLLISKLRLDAAGFKMEKSFNQPLRYGCSHVLRYGTQSLQPAPAVAVLLDRFVKLAKGGMNTMVEQNDAERADQIAIMVERLAKLTWITNWPKHEMQGSTFMVPGLLPHAMSAFGVVDGAEAFATWSDQVLLWRPTGNGVPPKSALYPQLCIPYDAVGKPILKDDGVTPVPQTEHDPQHVQGQHLAWGWMLYGDVGCAVAMIHQWSVMKKMNVYAAPDKELNQRAFGRVAEATWWIAISCPDTATRFEAQHYLVWLLAYVVERAKKETAQVGMPVITMNYNAGSDHKDNNVSVWQTATNGRAPAFVMRHQELLDLLSEKDKQALFKTSRELLGLVANCLAHAVNLGQQHGVPFVTDYDEELAPVWRANGAVSGTDAWVLPVMRDIVELLGQHPLVQLVSLGLVQAFERADCLKVDPDDPPADRGHYEMLGIALDLMPSLGIKT